MLNNNNDYIMIFHVVALSDVTNKIILYKNDTITFSDLGSQ